MFSCLINIWFIHRTMSSQNKPNIIYFLVDDWGYNDVGYYGSTDTETPFIDKLVQEESIRLDKYYVLPECTATRCALLTGRYPMRYGMQGGVLYYRSSYALSRHEHLLSNEFQNQGYETHLVGKWHLGMMSYDYVPNQRGFDTFLGYYGGQILYYNHNGIEASCPTKLDFHWNNNDWNDEDRYTLYTYTDRILNIIDDNVEKQKQQKQHVHAHKEQKHGQIETQAETNKKSDGKKEDSNANLNPFFMYVGWQGSHTPSEAPDEYFLKYSDKNDYGDERNYFQAQTTMTDDLLKVIVNHLKYDANIWDNTILIVASDNGAKIGYGDNSPLRGSKFTLWEGGVRVPAFITGGFIPNNLKGSVLSDVAVHAIDWYPTLLTAAGIEQQSPNKLDGMDFWNFLVSGGNSEPVFLNENARKHVIIGEGSNEDTKEDATIQQHKKQGFKVQQQRQKQDKEEEMVVAAFNNEELNAMANDRYILLNVNNGECDASYGVCGAILYNNRWKLVVGANGLVSSENGLPQSDTCFWNRDFSVGGGNSNANDAIDCGGDYPYSAAIHLCDCKKIPCLFDLENDPCEYNDVYNDYSEIGDKLASKLEYYYSNEQVLSLWTTMNRIPAEITTKLNENQDYWQPWYEELFDYSSWQDIEFEQNLAKYRVDNGNSDHKDNSNAKYDSIRDSSWNDGVYGVAKGGVIIALVVVIVMTISSGLIILYKRFWSNKETEIKLIPRVDNNNEPDIYAFNVIGFKERGKTSYGSI